MAPKNNQVEPDETLNNENIVNESINETTPSKRPSRLRTAVNNAIAKLWIALSLTGGNGAFNVISLGTTGAIIAACEPKDQKGPDINVSKEILSSGISIKKPEILSNNGTTIRLGSIQIAVCSDESGIGDVTVNVNGKTIKKGENLTIDKSCYCTINATDIHGNPSSKTFKINLIDTTPECISHEKEVLAFQGDKITRSNGQLFVGTKTAFEFNNNEYNLTLKLGKQNKNGEIKYEDITNKLPFELSEIGDQNLEITLADKENGKTNSRKTTLKVSEVDNNEAPEIKREKTEANIFGGVKVTMENNQFSLGDVLYATGTDDSTENLTMSFEVDGRSYKSGDIVNVASDGKKHTGKLTFTDEKDKSKSGEINLENDITKSINGRENINNLNLKVGQEVNLLNNIEFKDAELKKVEIQINGQWQEISEPYHYTPTNTGSAAVRLTIQGPMGNTAQWTSNTLTIEKAPTIEYHAMPIENLDPYRILSSFGIGEVKGGDLNVYEHIKPLGIAEGMRMRKMMGLHGAGGHTAKEYNEYMSRNNLVMITEIPDSDKYTNFERIGESVEKSGSEDHHANNEQGILTEFAGDCTNLKVVGLPSDWEKDQRDLIYEHAQNNPNSMFIVCCSASPELWSKDSYDEQEWKQKIIDLCHLKNVTVIFAGGDTITKNGVKINKVYNGIYESTPDGMHIYASTANSDQNNFPNSHALVNTGTNPTGHVDITKGSGSLFPVGFNEDVLLAGFAFPYFSRRFGCFIGDPVPNGSSWNASYGTYINGGNLGLEFDLHADIEDMDQLLSMARSSSIENSVTLNGDTQKLQRLSVAEYIRQYNMTLDVPKKIKPGETIMLTKGYYKGTIYEGPGVEVYIKGIGWVANTKENESIIKAQDPFELEMRRVNAVGTSISKYGILPGNTFQITERTVDDQWNGVTISKDFSITVEQ